jgi:hypothetical protein
MVAISYFGVSLINRERQTEPLTLLVSRCESIQ